MQKRNHYPKHVFSWVLLPPTHRQTTDGPPTHRPTDHQPLTHRPTDPPTERFAESIIIFERLDNRNIFILKNTSTSGKIYNYASVYYTESLLVYMRHIRGSNFFFLVFSLFFSSPDISKLLLTLSLSFTVMTWSFTKSRLRHRLLHYCLYKDLKIYENQTLWQTLNIFSKLIIKTPE